MYIVRTTKKYRKAYKRALKQKDFDYLLLAEIIDTLSAGERLDAKYQDHQLAGELADQRECHLKHNLLLVYQKQDDILILLLIDLGSHDDLF